MSEYRCYQTKDTVAVGRPGEFDDAVVIISRVVGNEKARSLMRINAALLNGDIFEVDDEMEDFFRIHRGARRQEDTDE